MTEESEDTSVLVKSTKRRMQVSLLDDTVVVFDVEPRSKGDLLYRKVNAHLNLEEAEYFGLQFYDSEGNVCWLDPLKPINRQIREPTKVTFKFRVMFYTPDPNSVMEYTKYLFTLQVRRDLLDGRLYCSEDTGALLASYIVQGELGDYDPLSHKEGYLSGFQFVPNQTPEVEERIVEYHKSHRGQSPAEADHNMLEVARQLEMYGITLYPAKDSDGVDLSLAVYHMGILVYQDRHRMNMFSWAKIRKLSFKKKRFLIKLHPQVHDTDIVEFLLQSRNACKGFWKICIAHHSFFRQRTAANPNKKASILSRGSKYRYSGRTQKQILDESRDVYHPAAETDRNRSSRFSNRNDASYAKSPPSTIMPHSPSSPPPAFNTFTDTQSGPHHSTPSKRSEMSEDDGSFTLNESESSRKNSSQADDVFVNHVQEGTPALNSCEEHQVIKIYHRDTQEDAQESSQDEEAPEKNTREPFEKPEITHDKPLIVEALADEKAEELVASEAPAEESTDGPPEEDAPVKVSSSDGEIEAQVNSIIQRITEEYESGRSGWQYHLTIDKDTHKETETSTEVPETKRNGHVAGKEEELDVDLINKVKGVYLQPPLHYDSDSGSSCFRETEDEESTFEDDSSIASPSGTLKRQNRLNAAMASRPSGRYYYMAKEILLTERTYVKDLEVLTVSFRGVLSQNGLVSDALMTLLFDNIDPLYDFHCSLLAELEERISLWERTAQEGPRESVQRIGDIMHRNMRQIKLYTSYIQRHDKILVELEREAKKSRKFEEAYKEFELQKICYLPLNAFLLKPVQRFLYYKSILGRLFKEYPKNHADYQDTKLAYDEIMDACRQVNDSMKNLENLHKLVELERDLIGVENLVHPGREFIREGCLHKICRKGPQARMFFLFTDLLMYTSQGVTSTNQFRVRSQIPLHVLRIEEGGVELHGLYAFTVSGPGIRSFVVAASSQEEKFKWMEDLNAACNKMKLKMMCSTCNANQSHLSSFVGKELEILCSACRIEVEKLESLGEEERLKVINNKFPPPVIIKKTTQEIDSDDEGPSIMDQMSSLDRRHAHARTMSTRRVCWHRNTSISMAEYTLSVQNNISGELLRKFKNNSKWQRLWVVFTNFSMFFFKQYEDEAPLASLPLIGYTISKPVDSDNIYDEFAFKLQFKTHVYFFRAESEYAYERWMEVISSATKSASRTRIFSRMTSGDP